MTLLNWFAERVGPRETRDSWLEHPIVGGARWAYTLGAIIVTALVVLLITGLALMSVYAPATQTAWASVHFIQYKLPGGALLRGLHRVASDALLVALVVHMAHVIVVGAYKKPRELFFWLGLVLFLLSLSASITGHLLPWDQKGYWARRIETNIVGLAPVVGTIQQRLMQGGAELGALGLTRTYTVHVALLPLLIALVVVFRIRILRKIGWFSHKEVTRASDPYARQVSRNLLVSIAFLVSLFVLARALPAFLDAPADPQSDYPARPEWFLTPLFGLRKFFSGRGEFYGTVGIPTLVVLYVFALPFFDRTDSLRLRKRWLGVFPVIAFAGAFVGLSVWTLRHDAHDEEYQKAKRKADARASAAIHVAMEGVAPQGALYTLQHEPTLRAQSLFEKNCASCHVLGDFGDPKKPSAPSLNGWGTADWIAKMMHDPDALDRFGKTPYKGLMPSVDQPPADRKPDDPPFVAMIKNPDEMRAVSQFLAAQGDEPGETRAVDRAVDQATLSLGEKIVTTRCSTCHLFKGEGDDEGSGTAPELSGYGSIAWTRAQIANPATSVTYREKALEPGQKGHMPRFDTELSAADIDLLARWTRTAARTKSK